MRLNLYIILEELMEFHPRHNLPPVFSSAVDFPICSKKILTGTSKHLDGKTLYVTETDTFFRYLPCCIEAYFIIIDHVGTELTEQIGRASYIYLHTDRSIIELSNILDEIFCKYAEWEKRLNQALIQKWEIKPFLDICVEMLPNPIYLLDSLFSVLYTGGPLPDDIGETIFYYLLPHNYFDYEHQYINKSDYTRAEYMHRRHAYWETTDRSLYPFISYNLFINGTRFGDLNLVDTQVPITERQLYLMEYIGTQLTILLESQGYNIYSQDSAVHMLTSLLAGKTIPSEQVEQQLRRKNWAYNDTYYLLRLKKQDVLQQTEYALQLAVPRIRKVFPYSIMLYFEDSLVCLVRDSDQLQINQVTRKILGKYLINVQIKCGISSPFYNFYDINLYYQQASAALEAGFCYGQGEMIFDYANICFHHLLNSLKPGIDWRVFCEPKIFRLLEYDKLNHTSLFPTLCSFFENNQNLVETAAALFIHRNTVVQRLEKISEITGEQFRKKTVSGYWYLSCKIIEELEYKTR